MESIIKTLTVKEAIEQGYKHYVYSNDGFQALKEIADDNIDFSREDIFLVEKESYNPSGVSSKDLAELIADHLEENHCSESGDDTHQVYETIKELDFSDVEKRIDEALSLLTYYRASDIKLVP